MRAVLLAALTAGLLLACAQQESAETSAATEAPQIVASTYPLAFFADRIAGDRLQVSCPVPLEIDPAAWRPDRAKIESLQRADLILLHGAGLERWVDQVSLPLARTVTTTRALRGALQRLDSAALHAHGQRGSPVLSQLDPYSWLAPELASMEAKVVLTTLQDRFPEHAQSFASNYATLQLGFEDWQAALDRISARYGGTLLVASRHGYGYLARALRWRLEHVPLELDGDPQGASLDRLRELAREDPSQRRIVLWRSAPTTSVRQTLAVEGFESTVYACGEFVPESGSAGGEDLFELMKRNVERLEEALQLMPR